MKTTLIKLRSLVFIRLYRTSKLSNLTVSSYLHEIIVGCILGDLHVEKPSVKHNARLQFKQSTVNILYVEHMYELLKIYCTSPPINLSYFDARVNKLKTYSSCKVQTVSVPCFNIYRELFYDVSGEKHLPATLSEHFTEVSLAYWFMDDGYKGVKGYYFCTDSFSENDISILLEMLKEKFELHCSVHKTTNGPRIYIKSSSTDTFNKLVKPHMLNHFYYKLHE